jgi:Zn-dependent protease/CBS domain-containing protein
MRWSFKIARVAGIDVRIHATFLLLLGGIAYIYGVHSGIRGAFYAVVGTVLVFLCVLLHEFGHALAAKAYGISTADISLLPIGGVARMERMPEKPLQELVVALAGPLVNVIILLALGIVLAFAGGINLDAVSDPEGPDLLTMVLLANLIMLLFNLIPAFPLDGGRVLRALLATRMPYARATRIAASIGQGLAFAIGTFAAFKGLLLLGLIAIFIYMGAENESAFVQMRLASSGFPVSSAMITRFDTLDHRSTLDQAVDALLGTSQHEFPVLDDNGGMAGLLTKHNLLLGLRRFGPGTLVTEVMVRGLPSLLPQTSLERAFTVLHQSGSQALPVVDQTGRLIGLFTAENVSEFFLVQNALARPERRSAP